MSQVHVIARLPSRGCFCLLLMLEMQGIAGGWGCWQAGHQAGRHAGIQGSGRRITCASLRRVTVSSGHLASASAAM